MWNYGVEAWCNLEGRYVTIVANLTHLSGESYEQTLCSLGIMGAEYLRNVELAESIQIYSGLASILLVENIYAKQKIGNQLNIFMR